MLWAWRGFVLAVGLAAGCNGGDSRGLDSLSGGSLGGTTADPSSTGGSGDSEEGSSSSGEPMGPDMGLSGEQAAFRIDSLTLIDPHVYAALASKEPDPPCIDGTALLNSMYLMPSVSSGEINIVVLFPSLDLDAASMPASLLAAACLPAGAPTMCGELDPPETPLATTVDNVQNGECYRPDPTTLGVGYSMPNAPTGPCFISVGGELTLPLPGLAGGTSIVLQDVQFSANYQDDVLVEGVLAGFASQAEAEVTVLDDGMIIQGGATMWQVIAGGDACELTIDDTDTHPEHGIGAWIYFDFTASAVVWTG